MESCRSILNLAPNLTLILTLNLNLTLIGILQELHARIIQTRNSRKAQKTDAEAAAGGELSGPHAGESTGPFVLDSSRRMGSIGSMGSISGRLDVLHFLANAATNRAVQVCPQWWS